ncbi:MAG: NAD-dependent epimerase/dehydratase family protein [Planctomycetes bacterium]|nr:NAD-dependent epimerase/dehydratase family protein [Planctomycetota bacterium]
MDTGAFNGKRVLVVGGAGFVGSNLVRLLLSGSPEVEVVVVDNLLSSERENLPSDEARLELRVGSIADDAILGEIRDEFDTVFHLACFHGNQSSIHDPIADHDNNLLTTLKLFNHLSGFKRLERVVYSGAGCAAAKKTYDAASATTEEAPLSLDQDSPYSISKLVGEFYAVYFHKQHGLPVVRARFQNVYGPGEVLGAGQWRGTPHTVWRNVTPTFIYKALKGEVIPLHNAGASTRDFIFVEDICQGLIACALRGKPCEAYNIASGRESSIKELAEHIVSLTKSAGGFEVLPRRDWDTSGKRFGSPEKSRTELGFEAKVPLEEGLARTVAWMQDNLPRIEGCMAKHQAQLEALAGS